MEAPAEWCLSEWIAEWLGTRTLNHLNNGEVGKIVPRLERTKLGLYQDYSRFSSCWSILTDSRMSLCFSLTPHKPLEWPLSSLIDPVNSSQAWSEPQKNLGANTNWTSMNSKNPTRFEPYCLPGWREGELRLSCHPLSAEPVYRWPLAGVRIWGGNNSKA